jgi:hypothetical protein
VELGDCRLFEAERCFVRHRLGPLAPARVDAV